MLITVFGWLEKVKSWGSSLMSITQYNIKKCCNKDNLNHLLLEVTTVAPTNSENTFLH